MDGSESFERALAASAADRVGSSPLAGCTVRHDLLKARGGQEH